MENNITFLNKLGTLFRPNDYEGVVVIQEEKDIQLPVVCRCTKHKRLVVWSVVNYYGKPSYYCGDESKVLRMESFSDILRTNFPKDFELIIWHPEILEGRYDK